MKRNLNLYLEDIRESLERIEGYIRGLDKDDFYHNFSIQDAVLRRLEIIGEAVKNLPKKFKENYPAVCWKEIAGLRDILIHEYFGVNLERIWHLLQKDLKTLKKQIDKLLLELGSNERQNN